MFETVFAARLKKMLAEKLKQIQNKDYVVITATENNSYRPLENDRNAISMVVKSGNATKSQIPGFDLNTLPMSVNFVVWEGQSKELLEALTAISEADNNVSGALDVDGEITHFKANYNTPYVAGSPQSIRSANDGNPCTIKGVTVSWFVTVTYSENATIEPPSYRLKIGNNEYAVDFLINCSKASAPAREGRMVSGIKYIQQAVLSGNKSYVLVLCRAKSGVSPLQEVLLSEIENGDDLLGQEITLIRVVGDNRINIPITNYSVNDDYNSAGVITLTLGR